MNSVLRSNLSASQSSAYGQPPSPVAWPSGKTFAFTIFDDTDGSTKENIAPIYRLFLELGFRTTKSVWVQTGVTPAQARADTCDEPGYVALVKGLQQAGFEIALHNASWGGCKRWEIATALDRFRDLFGDTPTSLAQHGDCNENIYWADKRVSGIRRAIYRCCRDHTHYHPEGDLPGSSFFWGDMCERNIKYVRNFVYRDINTLKACPEMPYHDPQRPFVKYWFASSDGCDPAGFVRLLSPANQDRLEEERGACIVYTHLYNFSENGQVLSEVEKLLQRLAKKNGWFVPVGTMLDFLLANRPEVELTDAQRRRLEWHWLHDVMLAHAGDLVRQLAH